MSLMRSIALVMGLMIAACVGNDAIGQWDGEYQYSAYGGQTGGGSPITMRLTLTIKKFSSNGSCLLHAAGFQTLETIVCTATENGKKLDVNFKSYDDGRVLNGYDVARYKVGELLFTLEEVEGKNKEIRYVPRWASYMVFDDMSKVKEYFKKTK